MYFLTFQRLFAAYCHSILDVYFLTSDEKDVTLQASNFI